MIHGHCTECDTPVDCTDLFLALSFHAAVRPPLADPGDTPCPSGYCPFCVQGRTQIAALCRECYLQWQNEEDRYEDLTDYRADIRDLVTFNGWSLSQRELNRSGTFYYLRRTGAAWQTAMVGDIQDGVVTTRDGGGQRREEAPLPDGVIRCHCNNCR